MDAEEFGGALDFGVKRLFRVVGLPDEVSTGLL